MTEEAALIKKIEEKVCKNCNFYNKIFGVCRGELLPVELAIAKNLAGKRLCDNVKVMTLTCPVDLEENKEVVEDGADVF